MKAIQFRNDNSLYSIFEKYYSHVAHATLKTRFSSEYRGSISPREYIRGSYGFHGKLYVSDIKCVGMILLNILEEIKLKYLVK